MKWPDDFNVKQSRAWDEFHVHWVDTVAKKETQAAKKSGKAFPPVIKTYDQYKLKR